MPRLWTNARLSVAPMMDWTDRHCRFFHRQLSARALLYTEMVTAQAVVHGPRDRLLGFDPAEHPVALQLGGSEPGLLAQAVQAATPYGYGEINLNVGCPSDRVKSGCFGAVLMKDAGLVADCVAAMIAASGVEVTVKCRIGVDDQRPEDVLPLFLELIRAAGVRRVTIHARKAWLQGLSPKENREIPPLDYPLVLAMKRAFPDMHLSINGGVASIAQARDFLDQGLDGVMLGRAAYHEPWDTLSRADQLIWGDDSGPDPDHDPDHDPAPDPASVIDRMRPYIEHHLQGGGRLHQITRHMLGLFHGRQGARHWRRILSEGANREGVGLDLLDVALRATGATA